MDPEVPTGFEEEGLDKYFWDAGQLVKVDDQPEEDDPEELLAWRSPDIQKET